MKFSNNIPPDQISIAPFRTKVKSYTPSPRFCTKCLKYGHTKTRCSTSGHLCVNCGQEHPSDSMNSCGRPAKCHHCQGVGGDHMTFSRDCPEYKKQRDFCSLAYNHRTSFIEAGKMYNQGRMSLVLLQCPEVSPGCLGFCPRRLSLILRLEMHGCNLLHQNL